nr:hypothetical protein [Anaerolineae bacterium]
DDLVLDANLIQKAGQVPPAGPVHFVNDHVPAREMFPDPVGIDLDPAVALAAVQYPSRKVGQRIETPKVPLDLRLLKIRDRYLLVE